MTQDNGNGSRGSQGNEKKPPDLDDVAIIQESITTVLVSE